MDIVLDRDESHTFAIGLGLSEEEWQEGNKVMQQDLTTTMVAREIAAKRGVSMSQAYKIAARQRREQPPAPEGWGRKDHVLEALYRMNANGGVGVESLNSMLKAMNVKSNPADITQVLWDLQKQQYVTFTETHANSGSRMTRIRLTPGGRAYIVKKRGTPQQAATRAADGFKESGVRSSTQHGATHAVGIDKTYFRNHRKVAEGGPIEVVKVAAQPEIVPAVPYDPQKKAPLPPPLPQNQKAPLRDGRVTLEMEYVGDTDETSIALPRSEVERKYPVFAEVRAKAEHHALGRTKAAKMVEAASLISDIDPEQADVLMSRAAEMEGPSLTKLESELLRFLDEVTTGE